MLGARISLLNMLQYLDKEKYEPVVVSLDNEDGFLQALDKIGVRYYRLRLWNWRKGKYWWRIPFTIGRLVKIIRQEKVDIIHSNEFWCMPYAAIAGKMIAKLPVITHIRLFITPQKARQYCLKWADIIVCVSQATAELLKKWQYYSPEKVVTVYNGLDPDEYQDYEEKREAFRKEHQLTEKEIAIGEIAQLEPRKNQHRVLEMIPDIVRECPSARFFFIGASRHQEYEKQLFQRCRELELDQYCRFLGRRSDVPAVCAGLDISILPSSQEGFGRVLIESMYMKTPPVGSDKGGIPEVIDHGYSGFVFPLQRFELFKEYLLRLIKDKDLRLKMGTKGRDKVQRQFLATHCAREMEKIYQRLVDNRPNEKKEVKKE